MSIPIVAAEKHSTGIQCPKAVANVLLQTQLENNDIPEGMPHLFSVCVITEANSEYIIFQIPAIGHIYTEKVGGRYVYDHHWSPWMVKRAQIQQSSQALDIYNKIIINVKHWGPPAEMALEFLAKTLE